MNELQTVKRKARKKGTGRIFERGGVLWIDYSFRGKRYRESSGSALVKDAQALLRTRMGEMGTGRLIGPEAEKVTLQEMTEMLETEYTMNGRRTLSRAQGAAKNLTDHFGSDYRAVDLTADRIDRYVVRRQQEGRKNATIRRELATLKRMFSLAIRSRRLTHAPYIQPLEVNNTREGFFEAADLDAVLAQLPEYLQAPVRFAALTGWRRGEVLPLRWSQVDFNAGVVRLEPGTTKNGEGREFPFSTLPPLKALLEEQRERTRALEKDRAALIPFVFHREGEQIRSLRASWESAARRAGMPGALFHDLRRTAVRNLEAAGVSRSVAMKLTGHKTEAVYRRYAIADRKSLEEGVAKLASLHERPAGERSVRPIRATGPSTNGTVQAQSRKKGSKKPPIPTPGSRAYLHTTLHVTA